MEIMNLCLIIDPWLNFSALVSNTQSTGCWKHCWLAYLSFDPQLQNDEIGIPTKTETGEVVTQPCAPMDNPRDVDYAGNMMCYIHSLTYRPTEVTTCLK